MKRPICIYGLLYLLICLLAGIFGQERAESGFACEGDLVRLSGYVNRKTLTDGECRIYLRDVQGRSVSGQDGSGYPGEEQSGEEQKTIRCKGVICYFPDHAFREPSALPPIGCKVTVEGILRPFQKATNEGQFDRQSYEHIKNLDFFLQNTQIKTQSNRYNKLRESLWLFRQRMKKGYVCACTKDEAAFLTTVILGDASETDGQWKELFRKNGIAHILAVSGLHISLLGMGIYRLLSKCSFPQWLSRCFSLLVIILYGMMIDAGTSTMRALIMFAITISAGFFHRTYDSMTAFVIAACVLVSGNPAVFFDAGFLFSFGAVFAITVFYPAIKSLSEEEKTKNKIVAYLRDSLLLSVCVNLFLLPIQLCTYYELWVYAPLINLLILPFFPLLLYAGAAGGLAAVIHVEAGRILLLPCRVILVFYQCILSCAQSLPGGRLLSGRPRIWQIVLYYLLLFSVIAWTGYRKKADGITIVTAVSVIALALCIVCIHIRWHTKITFLDVGQGECCVIEQKDGSTFLIDAGSSDVMDCAKWRVLPFLKANGIQKIDYAFVSHPDDDHMNALIACMKGQKESGVCFLNLGLSAYAGSLGKYEQLTDAAREAGCNIHVFRPGDTVSACQKEQEPFTIQCLFPYGTEGFEDTNDQSLILYACFGETRILFTGDMSQAEEEAMLYDIRQHPRLREQIAKVDILKAAHHGSRYSGSSEFLTCVDPTVTVVSCGKHNSYGHPHQEFLERLNKETDSALYRTDRCGAVSIYVKKDGMEICSCFHENQ